MEQQSISFFNERGEITSTLTSDAVSIAANKEHFPGTWVDGDWRDQQVYVLSGKVKPRPENTARLVGSQLVNVPVPSTIHIDDAEYPCDEPTVDLEFPQPGTYKIRVEAWPHQDKEFTYENPA